jgi:hypothetical protein
MITRHVVPAVAVVILAACGGVTDSNPSGVQMRPELLRLATPSPSLSAHAGSAAAPSTVTLQSFRIPVREISLRGSADTSGTEIYRCMSGDCLIDMTGPALSNLLVAASVRVSAGEYDYMRIRTCEAGQEGYTVTARASAVIEGMTYSTRASGGMQAGGNAENVSLAFSGCDRLLALPQQVVVPQQAAAPIILRLYFDLDAIAWAAAGAPGNWPAVGCSVPLAGVANSAYICAAYPDVGASVGGQPPVLERYRINDGATLGLYFLQGSGQPIGGYARYAFVGELSGDPGFVPGYPLQGLGAGPDGRLRISFGNEPGIGIPSMVMAFFQRDSHQGQMLVHPGGWRSYQAVRLTP